MESITITADLAPYAMAERRELQEVRLTGEVYRIGRHAFYNCRRLKRLCFSDTLRDMEDGAFKNCEQLDELEIRRSGTPEKRGDCAGLKSILEELPGSFKVTFLGKEGQVESIYYFPSYLHDYEENNEARIINQVTYGIGAHYRECVRNVGIDVPVYDRLFRNCVVLDEDAAMQIALYRCLYPEDLRAEAEKNYREWLYDHRSQVLRHLAEQEDMELLRGWLGLEIYRSEPEWREATELLREAEKWEAVSLLMQERQKRYGQRKNKFEF